MFCAPSVSLSVRARLRWNTQFNGEPVPLAPYTYFNQLHGMRGLHHAPKQAKSQVLGPCVYEVSRTLSAANDKMPLRPETQIMLLSTSPKTEANSGPAMQGCTHMCEALHFMLIRYVYFFSIKCLSADHGVMHLSLA